MKRPQKAIVHAVAALAAISLVAACSADVSGSATTVVALPETFALHAATSEIAARTAMACTMAFWGRFITLSE
jgi:hypothetical protein